MSRHRSRSSSGERRSHRSKHHSTISKKHSKKHHKHKHKKKSSREKMRSPSRQSSSVEISIPAAHLKRLGLDYDDLSLREGAGTVSPGRSTAGALFSPVEGVVCDSTTADRQPAVLGPAADTGSVEEQQTASSPPPQQAVAGSVLAGTPRDIASPEPAGRSRSNSPCHALRELSKSPRKCSSSRRKRSRSPRKRSRSAREDSRSSREHFRSSRKRSRLSRERSRSPRKHSRSSRKRSRLPRERSRSPRERSRSPRKRSRSPRKQSKLSRKRSRSPRERSRSPKKRSKSSRKRSRSPWRRHRTQRSPLGRRSRHRRHGYSRSPSVDSSSGHSRSPHRRSASRRRHQRRSLSSVSFSASPRHGSPARRPRHRRYSRSPSHSGHGRRAYLTTPTVPASTLLKLVPVDPKAESIQAYTKLCTEMSSRRLVQAPPPSGPGGGGGGGRDGYSFREPFAASSAQQKPTANLVLHSNTWKTPAQAVLDRASPAGGGAGGGAAVRLFPVSDGKDHSTAGPDGSQDPQGAVVSAGQGVYRGVATLQSLPWGEHSRGFQAWTKKNMFLNLRPVRGGFGEAMLRKMGWKEGTPLGISGEGSVEPIMDLVKLDRKCLTTAGDPPLMRGGHHITMVPAGTTLPGPAPSPAHNMCSKGVYSGKHPVSVLQEFASKKRWDVQYDLVDCKGPSHQRNFKYKVTTPTGVFIPEDGSASKKAAKAQAALVCLVKIGLNVA